MASVLLPIADGSEEMEAITIVDILRRGGVEVIIAGLEDGPVTCSRGTVIVPDATLDDALERDFDMVALPGGMPGAERLKNDPRLQALIRSMADEGKFVSAICAAPMALSHAGVLEGKKATSYPGFLDGDEHAGVTYTGSAVECDGNVITSRACPYKCSYCFNHAQLALTRLDGETRRWFDRRSVENVVAEINELRERYPLDKVLYIDDSFIQSRDWLDAFLDGYTE
ncbi:MAG: DJ-1/PfpI family protein, partial [Proteobacteria bacterium]|nr:DJ-1/PfpI family protein [Pseudomonadota bacterium]